MNYDDILTELAEVYKAGATQKEIADKAGISHQYISQLMTGRVKPESLTLRKLSQLFPDARIEFGGDRRIGDVHHNTNSPVIQGDGNTIGTTACEETAAAFLKRIMEADDIDAETKVKIYRMMK